MRLVADEGVDQPIVAALRSTGFEVEKPWAMFSLKLS